MATSFKKEQNKTSPQIVIISGMHRSGTSLLAAYLQKCGLDIGSSLLGPAPDNKKGYFEDAEFVSFNKRLLARNRTSMLLPREINLNSNEVNELHKLTEKEKNQPWGWKDPRNTIFLEHYEKLIPTANYVFIFRHPYLTVDSLIRRSTDREIRICPLIAAHAYLWYNTKILNFVSNHRGRCVVVQLKDFVGNPKKLIIKMNEKFGLKLKPRNLEGIYEENLLKQEKKFGIISKIVIRIYKNKLDKCFEKLRELESNL